MNSGVKKADVFLLFLLVHSFYIVPPFNSSYFSVIVVFLFGFFLKPKFISAVIKLLSNRYIITIYAIIFIMMIINYLYVAFHGTSDFSYLKNYISQIIQLTIIIFIAGYIFYGNRYTPKDYAASLIVWIFLIQSIIELAAFLMPAFTNIIHLTYSDETVNLIYQGYGGVRGLALTGSPGWGLSVGYGFSFLFFIKEYIVGKSITLVKIIMFLVLILGTFFAGRTGFVGVILGAIFYILTSGSIFLKLKNIILGLLFITLVISGTYLLLPNVSNLIVEKVFPFVFEFYYSYENTGQIETNSTNILLDMWSIDMTGKTFWIGDGVFTDPVTGKYYMHTDVGYLRNILFGGIIWTIFVIIYHFYLSCGSFLITKKISDENKYFIIILFFYAFILEAKAMILGFNKYAFTILIFYFISILYELKDKRNIYA